MDLVQITDARLGASALTVRITAVEEDDEGTLSITAEEFFGGYSTAPLYSSQSGAGYVPNWNSPPGTANPPIIFEPPPALLKGDLEIWVALSGGANWGGAQVWVSSDGSSYAMAGTVTSPAPQGVLSADLPAHSSPDTVDTLAARCGCPLITRGRFVHRVGRSGCCGNTPMGPSVQVRYRSRGSADVTGADSPAQ